MKIWPRLNKYGKGSEKRKTCRICGDHTKSVICMEYSRMRGDDEVKKVCEKCKKKFSDEALAKLFRVDKHANKKQREADAAQSN